MDWVATTLGAVSTWASGGTPKKDEASYWNGDIPWISANSMHVTRFSESDLMITETGLKSGSRLALRDTVLLLVRGSALHSRMPVGIALRDVAFNQDVKAITAKSDAIRPWYLLYWLMGNERFLLDTVVEYTGIGAGKLDTKRMQGLDLLLPPLREQDEILQVIRSVDDRITLLRETNATLEAIAQALFKSWFVDFDPVRAKMEGRAPEGMDEATAALFPDALEESELGWVPKGWRHSTVGESFILTMGQSPPGETYNGAGNGLPFYQGRTDFGFRFPTQRIYCNAPTRVADIDDTLVSVRAPVGDVNMAIEKCCIGRGVASVRHPKGHRGFTFYAIRGLGERFKTFDSEGTVFGSINKKDFQSLPIVDPRQDVLDAYDAVSHPIDQRILDNEQQLRVLTSLRDTLLPRLISGQLRLPEAQALVAAA